MTEHGNWTVIESDPGVFTDLIDGIGVKGVQVEELYSLSQLDELVMENVDVYGLVFLFKYVESAYKSADEKIEQFSRPGMFFARQVINNACATQALLSVLLNTKKEQVDLGPELSAFKEFTADFPPEIRGVAISNCEKVRTVHNSFARADSFVLEDKRRDKEEDAYHFISYIPFDNQLFELDGLKEGPINWGPVSNNNNNNNNNNNSSGGSNINVKAADKNAWLEAAKAVIEKRIERYSQTEIHFNLMAIIQKPSDVFNAEKKKINSQMMRLSATILSLGGTIPQNISISDDDDNMADDDNSNSKPINHTAKDLPALQSQLTKLNERLGEMNTKLALEKRKREKWSEENKRRKHNYLPFLMNFLRVLAEKGQLHPLIEQGKAKRKQKNDAARLAKQQKQQQQQQQQNK